MAPYTNPNHANITLMDPLQICKVNTPRALTNRHTLMDADLSRESNNLHGASPP